MKSELCDRCPAGAKSLDAPGVLDFLENDWNACESCPHGKELRVAAQQFRLRKSQWWVVNGRAVIPIWVVEHLRKRAYEV